ncbi:hypothetical protein Tco_0587330, partial [Tanacetum coccineum]
KAVVQKFREYDKKLEALTNFNVSEASKKMPPPNPSNTYIQPTS